MFKEKTRLYKVYHIREKGSTDVTKGYVGITRHSLSYRLGQHFCSNRPVGTTLRRLGRDNVEIIQLAMLPKDAALELEYQLRPELTIGWNVRAGGNRSTVKCTCGKYLPKRRTGSLCIECYKKGLAAGYIPHNSTGRGEHYILTAPDGVIYKPEAFTIFCRDHNLTPQNLRKVAKGTRKHHKGWTARVA